MELNGIEYIELSMANYDEDGVSQLNAWAIEAYGKIAQLEAENKQLKAEVENLQLQCEILNDGKCRAIVNTKEKHNEWVQSLVDDVDTPALKQFLEQLKE